MQSYELDIVGCPQCGAPAEVLDRFVLPSTDGPIDHLKMMCVDRHWFMLAVDRLPGCPDQVADHETSLRPPR